MLTDIEEEFGIDRGKSGFIQTSFIILYSVGAPLFGYLGDRYSRKWLMIVGIAAWGTSTLVATFMPVRFHMNIHN